MKILDIHFRKIHIFINLGAPGIVGSFCKQEISMLALLWCFLQLSKCLETVYTAYILTLSVEPVSRFQAFNSAKAPSISTVISAVNLFLYCNLPLIYQCNSCVRSRLWTDHMFSSHKSRSQCGPQSIFLLSILPFCSSQSKHRLQKLDAVQQFSAVAQAVGKHFLLCSHSSEAVTAEVSMSSHWLNKCPQGYFHPLMLSSLSLLIHSQLLRGWSQDISD